MSVITILALQILAVASLPVKVPPSGVLEPPRQLRGGSAPVAASNASNVTTVPSLNGLVAQGGHFYYANSCEDCVYKEAQCGCEHAVELFACFTKHCNSSDHSKFAAKCAEVSTSCSTELDIACRGPATQCKGKHNQLPSGGIGLTLDLDGVDNDAFCGPFGVCTGVVHMKANIYYPPPPPKAAPAPAPAGAPSPANITHPAPTLAAAPSPANMTHPVSLECGLPIVPNADVDNQTHWTLCRAPVIGGVLQVGCDLPMIPSLKAGDGKEAYCVLTEGTLTLSPTRGMAESLGTPPKRLTQPAWHLISNTYEEANVTTTPAAGFWVKSGFWNRAEARAEETERTSH